MRHPLLALDKVAPLVGDLLILESHIDMVRDDVAYMRFYAGDELNEDPTNWWVPNVPCIEAMLKDVGFADIRRMPSFPERAIFHARRGKP
jgi:hypothetical protein